MPSGHQQRHLVEGSLMARERVDVAERTGAGLTASTRDQRILLGMMLVAALALSWIVLSFYGPILWGLVISQIFAPLNQGLLLRTGGRHNVSAVLTLLAAICLVILPFSFLCVSLVREAESVYERLKSGGWNLHDYLRRVFDKLPESVTVWLDRLGWGEFDVLQQKVVGALEQLIQLIAGQVLGLGQNTFEFVTGVFITLYLAFFLIRDGRALARSARRSMPLAHAYQRELIRKFGTVIRATVKGNLLMAALQGLLGGLAFWALGVSAPLLWGTTMGFLSLVPVVGAALVWAPVALYFLIADVTWKGVVLAAFGALVIGLVDNMLRPMLVGSDTRLPDYVVLTTTLGGVAVLGINGFIVGPLIAAMFVAVWHIYGQLRTRAR